MTSRPQSDPDVDEWFRRCLGAAPRAPYPLLHVVAASLANPRASSDALLVLADALDEASQTAGFNGRQLLCTELHALAELPRRLAPYRAGRTDVGSEPSDRDPPDGTVAFLEPETAPPGWLLKLRRRFRVPARATIASLVSNP